MSVSGLYAHVPFCLRKCPYCSFNSVAVGPEGAPGERYVSCLAKEVELAAASGSVKGPAETIYLGGGTPSLLSPACVRRLLASVEAALGPGASEVTIEANPDAVDLDKLRGYLDSGVNRISIGFQALDDAALAALGRAHGESGALRSFELARKAGFANIGVDLIYGAPGQRMRAWKEALDRVAGLRPEHISLYGMTIEEGTPFFRRYGPGAGALPGEEAEAQMYGEAVGALKAAGYLHYEISNFALPGRQSAHNTMYWKGRGYLGVGAGAHSYLPGPGWGRRWWNLSGPDEYMRALEAGKSPKEGGEELDRGQAVLEAVMLGLRMVEEGVVGREFRSRFGLWPRLEFKGLAGLLDEGLVVMRGEDVLLSRRGLLFLNEVALRLA